MVCCTAVSEVDIWKESEASSLKYHTVSLDLLLLLLAVLKTKSALLHFHYLTWKCYSKPLQTYHTQLSQQLYDVESKKCKEKHVMLKNCEFVPSTTTIRDQAMLCYTLVMLQIFVRNLIIVILNLDIVPGYKGYGWFRVRVSVKVRVSVRIRVSVKVKVMVMVRVSHVEYRISHRKSAKFFLIKHCIRSQELSRSNTSTDSALFAIRS